MLEFIRNRAQSWIAWIIVGFIVITFALWGVSNYLTGGGDAPIAEVNGIAVTQAELQNSYQRQRQQMQQLLGDNFRPEMFPEQQMKQRVLEGIIERDLLLSAAMDAGYRIGDQFLIDYLRSIPQFQKDGKFSTEAYEQTLRMQGYLAGNFENILRRDLIAQQYLAGVEQLGFVTTAEQAAYRRLDGQKRRFGYMVFPASKFIDDISVSDDEVESFYRDNTPLFAIPEQVSIEYLELDAAAIAAELAVDESELRSRYESQKEMNYRTAEERRASHILVALPEEPSDEELRAAEERVAKIQKRLEAGESFAELASSESDDTGSAQQGGDLGFFGVGIMDSAFEKSAFSLNVGEVSEPVRSAFGFHLIKLEAIRGGEVKPYEAVRDELHNEIARERAEQRFFDQAEILANLTYEQPDTLSVATKELGLTVKQAGPFSREGGEGIAREAKVVSAAFAEDVLVRGNNSEPVELDSDHMVVLRVSEHLPASTTPLEQVRERIIEQLKRQKGLAEAERQVAEYLQELRSGTSAESIAGSSGTELIESGLIGRREMAIDPQLVKEAFRTPKPEAEGTAVWRHVATSQGEQALLGLYEVVEGDTADGAVETALANSTESLGYRAILESLRVRADIEINAK